jgi:type IV pilus assembly protein PilW
MKYNREKNEGFTVIELLIALAISVILMAGVYGAYRTHARTSVTQEGIVDLMQSMRTALALMEREIRMAGYDPTETANAAIRIADIGEISFEMDLNDDGNPSPAAATDPNERIRFALTNDANAEGIADGMPCALGREVWDGGLQPLVENVEALNFVYLDGNEPPVSLTRPVAAPDQIQTVQVTVVARTQGKASRSFHSLQG